MLLGYNTNGFAHHRLEDAIDVIAGIGYRSVALTLDYHALNPYGDAYEDQKAGVAQLLKRHDLRCVIETGARFLLDPMRKHQPTLLDPNAHERAKRRTFLIKAIDLAADLNADAVSLWSGAAPQATGEVDAMHRLVDECKALVDHASDKNVRLAFEPEPGMLIDTMSQFKTLHDRIKHPLFGLTLDVGHVHCLDDGDPVEHIRAWSGKLFNVHIEDMRRGVHDHLMFGEGDMNIPPILEALRALPEPIGVHVELSRHSHNAVATAQRAYTFLTNV